MCACVSLVSLMTSVVLVLHTPVTQPVCPISYGLYPVINIHTLHALVARTFEGQAGTPLLDRLSTYVHM